MQSRVVLTQGVTLRIIPTETEEAIGCFEAALATRDGSEHTVRGYVSDMRRFAQWYHERHPHASLTQEAVSADLYREHFQDRVFLLLQLFLVAAGSTPCHQPGHGQQAD